MFLVHITDVYFDQTASTTLETVNIIHNIGADVDEPDKKDPPLRLAFPLSLILALVLCRFRDANLYSTHPLRHLLRLSHVHSPV
jgi:hypothetical protein